jgi:hypothetical protein
LHAIRFKVREFKPHSILWSISPDD